MSRLVGSILHGAYGDCYEQAIALRYFKRQNPQDKLIVFFASDSRKKELEVFDLSFADALYPRAAIPDVPVQTFLQFQVLDPELKTEVLDHLPPAVLGRIDQTRNLKPWTYLRRAWREAPDLCDIGLSDVGRQRLPACEAADGVAPGLFGTRPTIGFLWRYRKPGGAISPRGQRPEDDLIRRNAELFGRLIAEYGAHVFVCGMNVVTTDANRERTDNKYTKRSLALPEDKVTYLQGLNWGLELEIIRRCTLCVVMASGFSEALWLKRRGRATVLVDAPLHYVAKLLWNRMPLFQIGRPGELLFQLRQPHSAAGVRRHLEKQDVLSPWPCLASGTPALAKERS